VNAPQPNPQELAALHEMLDRARELRGSAIPCIPPNMTKIVAVLTQILRTVEPATFADRALPWE
jgi:hypothetical protein